MILFREDWAKYPSAIPDISTTNKSWLRLAGLYKSMGVRNHGFHLALHNPILQGVDPYDPDLTQEQILAIATECIENPWYFFREVLRVPTPGAAENIRIRANRFNVANWWLFFNHCSSFSLCSRQTGKSLAITSMDVYILAVAGISTEIHLLTKDDDLRMKTVAMVKEMMEELPWYLRMKSKKDTYNTEKITIERLGNVYHTSVAQASPKAANNIGRGLTVAIHKIDEFAFIKNIDITLPSLLASASAARESAKAHGSFFANCFATTAGYLSSPEGRFAYKVYKECCRWSETFYDANNEEQLYEIIRKNSPSGKEQVLLEFNHRMLGYSDEWLKDKIQSAMADGVKAEAEFLNIWAEGNESSPISKEHLKIINDSIVNDPKTTITTYGYIIRWYVPEQEIENKLPTRKLVMGLDTSDAVGNDDIAMCMRDATTGEIVAAGIYNETNLITFANWLADFLIEYPNVTLIIERRSSGVTIIDNLLLILPSKGVDPFRRIFNWVTNDALVNEEYKQVLVNSMCVRDVSLYNKYRKEFGYATSAVGRSSRDNLYGLAFNACIKYCGSTIRDRTIISQLNTLVRRNDRIDHEVGEHDDACFVGNMNVRTINGNKKIKNIKLGDLVLTREGFNPVIAISKRKKEVISKYGITGTPDHPFITPNGIIKFENIQDETEVYIWKEKLLSIKAKDIIGTLIQKEDNTESTIGNMIKINQRQYHYTDKYGLITTGKYLKDIKYTILMEIQKIMISAILNVLRQKSITKSTQCQKKKEKEEVLKKNKMVSLLNGNKKTQNYLRKLLKKTGINRYRSYKRGLKIIMKNMSKDVEIMVKKIIGQLDGNLKNGGKKIQKNIRNNLKLMQEKEWLNLMNGDKTIEIKLKNLVEKALLDYKNTGELENSKNLNKEEVVYNLTIANCHEYFVNDVLVHNCIALLLTYWFLTQAKNLQAYGINPNTVLTVVNDYIINEEGGEEAAVNKKRNAAIKQEIDILASKLKQASNPMDKERITTKMRYLASQVVNDNSIKLNIEALIKEVKKDRGVLNYGTFRLI